MIKISEETVTIREGSLSINEAIEERSTCSFIVINSGEKHFKKGQQVEVFDGEDLIFSGFIDTSRERRISPDGTLFHDIQCIDNHYLVDKRIIAQAYQETDAGTIVNDIITNYLAEEGITAGVIQTGPLIQEAIFNYIRITDALDSLAEKSGFWWKVDENKELQFVARSTNTSPFDVTPTNIRYGSVQVENGNPKYRNKQYERGGRDLTDTQIETKRGDGDSQSFIVGFPIAKVPTVEINLNGAGYTAQTVGIRGVDDDKQWYWSKGSNTISQDESGTPLTSNDVIRITYIGEFDIVVVSQITEQIDNRKDVEGGSGIVEDVQDNPYTSNRETGFQNANAKLEKYGVIGRRVTFTVQEKGLETGQIVKVTIPDHELNENELLIESVNITQSTHITWYNVTAIEGPTGTSWTKMFYHMATRGQTFVLRENIREDQILIILETFTKTWTEEEIPNIFRIIRPGVGLKPGFKPMFDYNDRVKYMSWYDGSTELGRKVITKQTGADTDEIESITFLAPFEANETITHLGWWGGWQASGTLGTGIEVDKQTYSKTKTNLEAIQVDKTDTKGAW